jgi:hypothetical protein
VPLAVLPLAVLIALLVGACAGEDERSSEPAPRAPAPAATAPTETETTRERGATTAPDPAETETVQDEETPVSPPVTGPAPAVPAPKQKPAQPDEGRLAQTRLFVGFHDDPSFRWRRDRGAMLRRARAAGATVIRTTVEWSEVAPRPPVRAGDPFDPSLRLDGIDELVRNAQRLGVEVLLTVWGTPDWANGGAGRNRVPDDLGDLEAFSRALADRYSGRHPGYPFVRFYSVWNEPNLEQFLAPQFDRRGRSVSPWLYHQLFRAARAGIKAASPRALVAAGETSPRGRDRPSRDRIQDSHSPAGFAARLGRLRPRLRFDAWAHHPYPTSARSGPLDHSPWPSVRMANLGRFEAGLDQWFGRSAIPIWLTEYAHETRPHDPKGADAESQASFAREALAAAAADRRVRMFIWFTFRDDRSNPWQSGLLTNRSQAKPAFAAFGGTAGKLDARVSVRDDGNGRAVVRVAALELAYYAGAGAAVGVTAHVTGPGVNFVRHPRVRLGRDGWLTFRLPLEPAVGGSYSLRVRAGDVHGHEIARRVVLRGVG